MLSRGMMSGSSLHVIARCEKRAVAIQSLDGLGTLSLSKRLDCFVAPLLAMTCFSHNRI